jgi:hypothetical protein
MMVASSPLNTFQLICGNRMQIKICNRNHLLHLVGILFPHINNDVQSKSLHISVDLCADWWLVVVTTVTKLWVPEMVENFCPSEGGLGIMELIKCSYGNILTTASQYTHVHTHTHTHTVHKISPWNIEVFTVENIFMWTFYCVLYF